jgi:hypothetical protein
LDEPERLCRGQDRCLVQAVRGESVVELLELIEEQRQRRFLRR